MILDRFLDFHHMKSWSLSSRLHVSHSLLVRCHTSQTFPLLIERATSLHRSPPQSAATATLVHQAVPGHESPNMASPAVARTQAEADAM